MRGCLLLLALSGCTSGAWYEPSEVEARTDWTDIDHDQDVFDGNSMTYGVSLKWPLGLQRKAYLEQGALGDRIDKLFEKPAPIEIQPPPPEKAEPFKLFGIELPAWLSSTEAVSGIPMFAWGAMALVLIAAALWIFKGAGISKWIKAKVKKEPKNHA